MPSLPSVHALRERYYQLVVDHLLREGRTRRVVLKQIAGIVGLHAEDMAAVLADLESVGLVSERAPGPGRGERVYSLKTDTPIKIRDDSERGTGYWPGGRPE